jgi:hypothetical protein
MKVTTLKSIVTESVQGPETCLLKNISHDIFCLTVNVSSLQQRSALSGNIYTCNSFLANNSSVSFLPLHYSISFSGSALFWIFWICSY